jgi:hypothetical protein
MARPQVQRAALAVGAAAAGFVVYRIWSRRRK